MAWLSRAAAILLAVLMLFFGVLMAAYGTDIDFAADGVALAVANLLLSLLGGATVVLAAWTLISLGRLKLPLRLGGIAALVCGVVLAFAAASGVLPCSGPT